MKKWILLIAFIAFSVFSDRLFGQSQEAQQLLLNWEKLEQFKRILQDMKDGYAIVSKGYTTIRDISSGNFKLHKTFLDALLQVSPTVRNYKRVADIIHYQLKIVSQYNGATRQFKEEGALTADEIHYIQKVYTNLFKESLKNLDELTMVITAGRLRMSDDERLEAIDGIYASIEDQFNFLQDFTVGTKYLSLQRKNEQADVKMSKRISGY